MLLLLFEIGNGRYALDVNEIVEVVPLVILKRIQSTPDYVAGLMNYRGTGTPVIDLNHLLESVPYENVFSTRVIVVRYRLRGGDTKLLAMIASNVTETARTELERPPPTGVFMDKSLYAGNIIPEPEEMIQYFDIQKVLPENEITRMFEEEEQKAAETGSG